MNCPKCGKEMVERRGKWGFFLGCTGYPKCNGLAKLPKGYKGTGARTGKVPPVIAPLAKPSGEQSAIFAAVTSAALMACHWIISALAGTGKTTVLVQLVALLVKQGHNVLALAFTSKDAGELDKRINGDTENGTVAKCWSNNQAGMSMLGAHVRGIRINTEADTDMLRALWVQDGLIVLGGDGGRDKWEGNYGDFQAVLTLVEKARNCLPLKNPQKPTAGQWQELMVRFDVEAVEEGNVLHYAAVLYGQMADIEYIRKFGADLTSQVFLPVYHSMRPRKLYTRVLVDELQDQNYACRALALAYLAPGGKIIGVGDKHQAIYEWRGADSAAIDVMIAALGTVKLFPLTLCRRCCKAVVRTAQKLVPEIQALDEAPEGESDLHYPDPQQLFEELKVRRKGLVICRLNAPIISLCLKLMAAGVRAALMKGDIVRQLRSLIDQLSEKNADMNISELFRRANDWASARIAKLANYRNSENKIALVQDKLACLQALADADDIQTAGQLTARIQSLYPDGTVIDPDTAVILSTVHGAKGREADSVYIFSPVPKKGTGSVFDQVWGSATDRNNTLYVAITRARLRLVFAGPMPTLARFEEPEPQEEEEEYNVTAGAHALVGGSDGQAELNQSSLFGDNELEEVAMDIRQ